jgi:hypothetical protein
MSYRPTRNHPDVTVAASSDESTGVRLLDGVLIGFITPSAMDSTAVTFLVCDTFGGTYVELYDSNGNTPTLTSLTVDTAYSITGSELDALSVWPFFKFKMGTTETAERTFVVVSK